MKIYWADSSIFIVTSEGIFKSDSSGVTSDSDTIYHINAATFDGTSSFYLTGVLDSSGSRIPYVRKLSLELQEEFLQLIPVTSSYAPIPKSIVKGGNGRIFIAGSAYDSTLFPSNVQYFAGIDSAGNVAWSYVYGIGPDEQAFKMMKCDHSGNAVIGSDVGLSGPSAGEMHYRKFDSSGNILHENLFDPVYARDLLSDIDFGTAGQTFLTGPFNLTGIIGNTSSALVIFDSSGLFSSFSTFDGYGYDERQHILADGNGYLYGIVSGTDHSGPRDSHFDIMKFEETGTQTWSTRNRNGSITYQKADALKLSRNGKLFVVGEHRDDTLSVRSGLIAVYDTSGAIEYELIEDYPGFDVIYTDMLDLTDSVYFLLGSYTSTSTTDRTVLAKYGYTTTSIPEMASSSPTMIYPNPATNVFHVQVSGKITTVMISDVAGHSIKSFQVCDNGFYNISDLPTGCYMVTVFTDQGVCRSRLLVE
ncbi:MAG: T9SS type A sorting domain-containing protein [Bacteroidota bacterium]